MASVSPVGLARCRARAGAGLGDHPRRQPGQHLRLLQGLQDVPRAGPHGPDAPPCLRAGTPPAPAVQGTMHSPCVGRQSFSQHVRSVHPDLHMSHCCSWCGCPRWGSIMPCSAAAAPAASAAPLALRRPPMPTRCTWRTRRAGSTLSRSRRRPPSQAPSRSATPSPSTGAALGPFNHATLCFTPHPAPALVGSAWQFAQEEPPSKNPSKEPSEAAARTRLVCSQ